MWEGGRASDGNKEQGRQKEEEGGAKWFDCLACGRAALEGEGYFRVSARAPASSGTSQVVRQQRNVRASALGYGEGHTHTAADVDVGAYADETRRDETTCEVDGRVAAGG